MQQTAALAVAVGEVHSAQYKDCRPLHLPSKLCEHSIALSQSQDLITSISSSGSLSVLSGSSSIPSRMLVVSSCDT
jgi:hypothetical protein